MDKYEKHIIGDELLILEDALEYWQHNMPSTVWSDDIYNRIYDLTEELRSKKSEQ
ncbi:MAG: hypothetical protein IJU79_02200 [Desulfovibrionaceae bacterium]|nr:hypothetical protein [Desulfovibrionaceae bacterium]